MTYPKIKRTVVYDVHDPNTCNYIPAKHELVHDVDMNKYCIGDGIHTLSELPKIPGPIHKGYPVVLFSVGETVHIVSEDGTISTNVVTKIYDEGHGYQIVIDDGREFDMARDSGVRLFDDVVLAGLTSTAIKNFTS